MIIIKALVYSKSNDISCKDVEMPSIRTGCAKIKIKYCGICGGDIGIVAGIHPRAKGPLIIGHELVGTIEELPKNSDKFKIGDRVVAYPLISCGNCFQCRTGRPHMCETLKLLGIDINGAMAEYAIVNEDVLFKLDSNISDKAAALIEPLAVIVRAIHQSGFKFLDAAVVQGAGPIGILTAIALKHVGASKIVITDIDDHKLELCRELGFRTVNVRNENLKSIIDSITDGCGTDIVFEASGTEEATFESTDIARIGGTICMVGIHKAPHLFNLPQFSFKEQKMIATRVYTKYEFEQAVDFAMEIQNELEKLISHIIPLKEGHRAFDYINDPNVSTVKVLIDCEND